MTATSQEARRIVEQGVEIRQRIGDLASHAIKAGQAGLDQVRETVNDTVSGVREALDGVIPQNRESVLRQVFDGLSDAVAAGADATRQTISHASSRGRKFARHDLADAVHKLRALEQSFLDTVGHAATTLNDQARLELLDIVTQARRAGTQIAPAVASAIEAADGHMVDLARETASAAARAARNLTAAAATGLSGALARAGKALKTRKPAKKRTASKKRTKRPAKKARVKAVAKKAARRRMTKKKTSKRR